MSEQRKSIYRVSALGICYGSCDGLCRASLTRQKAQLGRLGVSARASACHLTSSYTSFKSQIRAHLLQGFSSPRPAPQTQGVCLRGTCLPRGNVLLPVCLLIPVGCYGWLISVCPSTSTVRGRE